MWLTQTDESRPAIVTDTGERLFELIGADEKLGSSKLQSLALSVIPAGKHSAAHYHKASAEVLYILQGSGELHVDENKYSVETGNVILLEPNEVHSLYNKSDEYDLKLLAITAPPWRASDAYAVD
ncbi:MAG: cupin domain-containing protein [Gammaproteobacteria bacterium]|nr:cupin domain-containing protein [Gammaproteobacteria bacterium]